MIENHIPVQFSDRRRRFIDRLTRRVVTASGVGILLIMMLLFFWLIWVVTPLFSSPSLQPVSTFALWQPQPAVAIGLNDKWGWRIDQQGMARFIPLSGEPAQPGLQLASGPVQAALTADKSAVLLLQSDDSVKLVAADLTTDPRAPQWRFPLGERSQTLSSQPLQHPAVARISADEWRVAASAGDHLVLADLQQNQPAQIRTINSAGNDQLILSPDGQLLFALAGDRLRVWRIDADAITLRDTITLQEKPQQMVLLSGGSSLLLAGPGGIGQWFDIASPTGPHLQFIRHFGATQPLIVSEPLRRVFATFSPQGDFQIYASKQQGPIFSQKLAAGITSAQFAPQGDGLLTEREGKWHYYRLHNPWPDFSWRNLWQKIWYEHYPQPAWVWQSSAASDHFQAKFSLVPMVAGTLKAAALALLFATPLALAAAIYTAWFMSPALRRWVKPGIEMMGALPSVVVGLIAGLWLAPRIADQLAGVLLLPFALAATLLLCAWGSRRLPANWRRRLCAEGREIWLLVPLLLLAGLLCLWLAPQLDRVLFGHGLAERLAQGYEQRNLLVAGVAMGFALVPLVFTLAEDAIFSVPASLGQGSLALGATPWQTLSRVVLPSASAGIFAALMIGFGRAVGETMIVLMATGNTPVTDGGLFSGLRTLSANIAVEMPEAAAGSAHYRILFLSALVLLVFTLVVNTLAEVVRQRLRQRFGQHEVQG